MPRSPFHTHENAHNEPAVNGAGGSRRDVRATGLLEEGSVDVAEMLRRGPWLDGSWDFPVEVISSARPQRDPASAPATAS